jgi:hypothetical protein
VFRNNIVVDDTHPLRVFVQVEGECNGVYVTEKSSDGFTVRELAHGTSDAPFSWSVVATRANTVDETGLVTSHFADVRFPAGPDRMPRRDRRFEPQTETLSTAPAPPQPPPAAKRSFMR